MNWKIKALLQKALSITKLGDRLNHIPATLNKKHHYNVTLYQTYECIRKFSYSNTNLTTDKTALEIGTGYSLISSIVLSLLGFQKIVTGDITKDIRFLYVKKQLIYLDSSEILKKITSKSIFTEKEIIEKINKIKQEQTLDGLLNLLNIIYIAPYNFNTIQKISKEFHYITSQVVLEHVPPKKLDEIFKFIKKALVEKAISIHTINFIDHFTNDGIFQDKTISEFNFLKYSDKYWKHWTENPIAYTNRLSHLYYIDLCKQHDIKVVDFIGENYKKRKELDLKEIHDDVLKKYNFKVNLKDLTKYQRGTLIISNN